jgi:cell division protein FtsL
LLRGYELEIELKKGDTMAARTAEMDYAENAVYGNVAYDLSTAAGYAIPRERTANPPLERPREKVREREQVRTRTAAKEQTAFGVPVLGIFGIAIAAVMMVFVLFGYVQLAEISGEMGSLNSTISTLNEENAKLKVAYESTFNLNEIEDYAVNVLGMTKLADSNVTRFDIVKADKASILSEDDSTNGILAGIESFFDTVREYFK